MTWSLVVGGLTASALVALAVVVAASAVLRERAGPEPRVATVATSRVGWGLAMAAALVAAASTVALRLGYLS